MQLPNGWKKVKLGKIGRVSSGSTPLRSQKNFYENGTIPWVKTMDLNNKDIKFTDEKITTLAAQKCKPYPSQTLLVAMYGGFNQIGRTGILTFPASINQALAALSFNEKEVYAKYVQHYLNANVEKWRTFAASSRKDPNITSHDVENFEILLPPLAEQKKIAETLSVWDSAIEKMEKLIDEKENLFKVELKEKIIAKGFEENWEKFTVKDCIVALTPPSRISQDNYKKTGNFPIIDQSKELIAGWTNDENCIIRSSNPLIIFGDHTCILKIMEIPFAQGADGIKVLSANENFDASFLYYSLKADPVVPEGYKRHYSSLQRKEVFCPSRDIQKILARYFEIKEKELSLLKQQLALYKKQKQGLMQKLLTGEWRVK